jgi:hypothetical protein
VYMEGRKSEMGAEMGGLEDVFDSDYLQKYRRALLQARELKAKIAMQSAFDIFECI